MQIKIWGAAVAMAAMSFTVSAAEDGRNWLTLGLNVIYGHVDTPCGGSNGDRCSEQGPLNGFTGAFTTVGESGGLVRTRIGVMREPDTDDDPVEVAVLFGGRFGDSAAHGAIGVGRIFNPDDDLSGHRTGLAWEVFFAPETARESGFEFAIQGNFAGSVEYVGVNFGFRFGDMD